MSGPGARRAQGALWVIGSLGAALLLSTGVGRLGCTEQLEDHVSDRVRSPGRPRTFGGIVIVDLGPEFLPGTGYDWADGERHRSKCAELTRALDNLLALGARTVALDKLLGPRAGASAPGAAPPEPGELRYCTPTRSDDPLLTVLRTHARRLVVAVAAEVPRGSTLRQVTRLSGPGELIARVPGLRLGLVNLVSDPGGAVRGVPVRSRLPDGGTIPGFAVEAVRAFSRPGALEVRPGALRYQDRSLALRRNVLQVEPLAGAPVLPLALVGQELQTLDPALRTELRRQVEGRLVFVGSRHACLCRGVEDAEGDVHPTPHGAVSGVEIHASAAATLLAGGGLAVLPGAVVLLVLGLLALLAFALGRLVPLAWGLAAFGVVSALAVVGVIWLRLSARLLLPLVELGVALGVGFAGGVLRRVTAVSLERLRLWIAFRHYLSPVVIRELLRDPRALSLGGQEREVTLLFSDIRDFTTISEARTPVELTRFLNDYFTALTDRLMQHRGYLDKYIGDAIMGIFGAPVVCRDPAGPAQDACRTALSWLEVLPVKNAEWSAGGLPEVRIGIGIHTGQALVGNLGSHARFNYTALGDTVNLASRLEGLTKKYGVAVLVGERTRVLAEPAFVFREVDSVRVKGRGSPERIFELVGPRGMNAPPTYVQRYEAALAAYRCADFAAARRALETLLQERPEDGPARVLGERVAQLEQAPPGPDWDPTWSWDSK
jgi:adenylate cyclase